MTNPRYSDEEILDRVEADIRSTLASLMARVSGEFGDLTSVPSSTKAVAVESVPKEFTGCIQDLVASVEFIRERLPSDRDAMLDRIADGRRVARDLAAAE